jgi:formate dehydrogenase major subunit
MTNGWVDFRNSDVILVIGANPAENHPCGWKWAHVARDTRGAKIVHVDPRFTRTSAVADKWVPIRAGTDVAFFGGLINYILQNKLYHEEYVKLHTNASFIVSEDYEFSDGLFAGYDPENRIYDTSLWDYEREPTAKREPKSAGGGATIDERDQQAENPVPPIAKVGFAKRDETLRHPRTVLQLLKKHYSRYTPETVARITGIPEDTLIEIAELMGTTGVPDKVGNIIYAVGLTHHTSGTQMIRALAMVQLLLGNVGMVGGGVNAERGHANIQGNTDNAQSWEILPGYLAIPKPGHQNLDDYVESVAFEQLDPRAVNYFGTKYKDFTVSLLKAWFGDAATKSNDFAFNWLPKPDSNWSWMTFHDAAVNGDLEGLFNGGMSSVNIGPDSNRVVEALTNLKWFVVMDPLPTASSEFWRDYPGIDPKEVQTEVFFFPTTHWIEKSGSFTNSGRWAQWKHNAIPPEGDIKNDNFILAQLFLRLRELYRNEGGPFPDPILNLTWEYSNPDDPPAEELAQEINGRDLQSGLLLSTFDDLSDDGSTSAGNWIYTGSFTEEGNMMDRRGTEDPTGLGFYHGWAWSWPANRRILYNRASADANGDPWDPERPGIYWNGSEWVGDIPDFDPVSPPKDRVGAFIMTGEGVARLFSPGGLLLDGPLPEHYEQAESPIVNPLSKTDKNPAAFHYENVPASFAEDDSEFPYVATTYRVTEHEHYVTQHVPFLVESMPDFFVEISPELAGAKGIANTDMVQVRSKRGHVTAMALVTKRMRPLRLGNKVVHQIGIPLHWHYAGGKGKDATDRHLMANMLTPFIGDATTYTPEFKGFLVTIDKA